MAKKAKAKKAGEKDKAVKPDTAAPLPQKEEKAAQPKPQANKKANGGNGKLAELRKEVDAALKEKKKAQTQADELRSKAKEIEQTAKQAMPRFWFPTGLSASGLEPSASSPAGAALL